MLDVANEADAARPTVDSAWAEDSLWEARDPCCKQDPSQGTA
jgi:hypothetical protein